MIKIPKNLFPGSRHHLEAGKVLLEKADFKGKNVLDLGCGNGDFLYFIKNLGANEIIGIDIEKASIEKAKENVKIWNLGNIKLFVMDAHKLNFKNDYFDIVFCNLAFHHFVDKKVSLNEVMRVLKKGGRFYVNSLYKGYKNIFPKIKGYLLKEKPYSNYSENPSLSKKVDKKEMGDLLENAGFKNIKVWIQNVSYEEKNIDQLIEKYRGCRCNLATHLPEKLDRKLWEEIRKNLEKHFGGKSIEMTWKMVYAIAEK